MAKKNEQLNETAPGTPMPVNTPKSTDNGTVAAETLAQTQNGPQADPIVEMSKSKLMALAVEKMGGMEMDDLNKFLASLMTNTSAAQNASTDNSAKNFASIAAKPSHAVGASDTDPSLKVGPVVHEEIENLFSGNELTEEFKNKAATLFEAAVYTRIKIREQELQEQFDNDMIEAVKDITEEMTDRVDSYLTYAAEEFITENKVAIEESIKADIAMDFMKGLKKLFKEHYIKIPDKKVNVVKEMAKELDGTKKALNEAVAENIELKNKMNATARKNLSEEATVGLSANQKAKFMELVESVDASLPDDQFKGKLSILKEHILKPTTKTSGIGSESDRVQSNKTQTPEELNEEVRQNAEAAAKAVENKSTEVDSTVSHYAAAITRTGK